MQYCLAINTHSNQKTFCNAIDNVIGKSPKLFCTRLKATLNNYFFRPVERISNIGKKLSPFMRGNWKLFEKLVKKYFCTTDSKRGTALACTGLRNKQTLAGLVQNTQYFVDLFAIHSKVPGLIFKMASTTFIFNNTKPIELIEDRIEVGRLSTFDKRDSFVFKVNYY